MTSYHNTEELVSVLYSQVMDFFFFSAKIHSRLFSVFLNLRQSDKITSFNYLLLQPKVLQLHLEA